MQDGDLDKRSQKKPYKHLAHQYPFHLPSGLSIHVRN